ncbi:MAG: hypothetical protein FJ304_13210 [Planctomycetes bacterium]|nr:hypothetical protein [Planctomycetota bacterium]
MDLRALIFIPALVLAALCAFAFVLFAAHYYLTVLEGTAAGAKEIAWADEPITDNFWKPFYLAGLLCLWLGPAYVIGRALATNTQLAWVGFAVPVLVTWLLYPVSQLSSLSASSVWTPLSAQVFARLAQRPGTALSFFALTLPVFALGGLAFRWAFLTADEWPLLFAGAPLLALALLLYARLLGRLAFALLFTRDLFKRKKKKKPKAEAKPAPRDPEPAPRPADLPPITTPLDGELVGYNVLMTDDPPAAKKRVRAEVADDDVPPPAPPPAPPRRTAKSDHPLDRARAWTDEDEDATPYEMKPSEAPKPEEPRPSELLKPSAEEMALLDRSDAPKQPKRVWGGELFAFLGQPSTISALVILSTITALAGAAVRVARQFNPATGGEWV